MKNMARALLGVLPVVMFSMSTWAADGGMGKLDFSGKVVPGTCVIEANAINRDLGDLLKSSMPTSAWGEIVTYSDSFVVSGCPLELSNVSVTPDFVPVTGRGQYGTMQNNGSAGGVVAQLEPSASGGFLPLGVARNYPLVNGRADVTFATKVMRHDTADITPGSLDFSAQFIFDYQ